MPAVLLLGVGRPGKMCALHGQCIKRAQRFAGVGARTSTPGEPICRTALRVRRVRAFGAGVNSPWGLTVLARHGSATTSVPLRPSQWNCSGPACGLSRTDGAVSSSVR